MLYQGSSQEDQAALISDRVECIKELSTHVTSTNGIEVTDKLFSFTGDKPAAQFERGTSRVATINVDLVDVGQQEWMTYIAHSLNCRWRSLADLQTLVLAGEYMC